MHPLLLCFLPLLLSLPRLESSPVGSRSDSVASFTLLHLNDFHSHFEEVNEITGESPRLFHDEDASRQGWQFDLLKPNLKKKKMAGKVF